MNETWKELLFPFDVRIKETRRQNTIAGWPVRKGDVYTVDGYETDVDAFLSGRILIPRAWVEIPMLDALNEAQEFVTEIIDDLPIIEEAPKLEKIYANNPNYGRFA